MLIEDGAGKSSQIIGKIQVADQLILDSEQLGGGWFSSDWLGNFYSSQNGWIFHSSMNWLYIHSADGGGYWIWDTQMGGWIWTDAYIFPWLYRQYPAGWLYQMLDSEPIKVFDYKNKVWMSRE